MREYKLSPVLYFPVDCRVTPATPAQHRPHLDPARWPEVAERAPHASLRHLAAEYGVSHETIRTIVRRQARKRVAEATRVRLGPAAGCASRAGESSRRLTAGSS